MADVTLKYLLFGEDRTASKTVKGVGDAAEGTASKLSGLTSRLSGVIGGDFGMMLDKFSQTIGVAGDKVDTHGKKLTAIGGVAMGAGLALQQMASGDVEAQNKLAAAIESTGGSMDDYADRVDSLVESQVAFGNTDGDVKVALTKLVDGYGDAGKAADQMGLATDLAAAKNISLEEAAGLVAKAHNGNAKLFKEFGIVVGENADGTKNLDGAMSELSDKLSGRAAAGMDSFSGKLREGRAWLDNAASGFAESYGPAVTAAGAALTGLGVVLDVVKMRQAAAAAATVTATAATNGSTIATKIAAAGQWLWNAAMTANPIGLIVIAIAAFVAGVIWAWNNVDWFREGVTKAWEAIKTGWSALWDNVLEPGLLALGNAWRWLWNSVIAPVIRFLLNGFASITEGFSNVLRMLGNVPGFEWAKTAADKMDIAAGKARDLADNIDDIDEFKKVDVVVGYRITGSIQAAQDARLNRIPQYAKGGTNIPAGLAWVGERGPELIYVPGGSTIYDAQKSERMASSSASAVATNSMPSTLTVIDSDGALIGRMRVEASGVVAGVGDMATAGRRAY